MELHVMLNPYIPHTNHSSFNHVVAYKFSNSIIIEMPLCSVSVLLYLIYMLHKIKISCFNPLDHLKDLRIEDVMEER